MIAEGSKVSIEYTLKLDDGTTADSNVGRQPLVFEQGKGQLLPAFEEELAGRESGEVVEFRLGPEQGYGTVDPELRREVDLDAVPEEGREVGAQLVSEDQQGNRRVIRVHELRDATAVLDLNHPLAGEPLNFEVKILEVE